ncbi:Ger(x)C family spore germination protein [Paenibacillus urinalis]|uniref:Ger(X)C family spore germination protein n=1 Tax=Paenibacillus urinalis TaxID=521520 RepID=A0AAX3MXK0_9BACL|nr:Ger(x)C family spore germination protein [Paenibacillus urinalis]WDH82078.1 Ger(x)C family spore germination protein [Paenibacillus urinalis]
MRKAYRWPAVIAMLLLMTGCWDSKELNNQAFALGGGIDYVPDQGYRVTNQFALISGGGAEGGDKQQDYTEVGEPKSTIYEASSYVQNKVSRIINRGHRRTLVMGEELAKIGLKDVIDIYSRYPETPLRSDIFVVKGGLASDFLKSKTPYGNQAVREYYKLHQSHREVADITFLNLLRSVNSDSMGGAVLPAVEKVPEAEGKKEKTVMPYRYIGNAVLDNNLKLRGYLDNQEVGYLMWFLMRERSVSVTDLTSDIGGEGAISAEIKSLKSRYRPTFEGDNVAMHFKLSGDAHINENNSGLDLYNAEVIRRMEWEIGQEIAKDEQELIRKIQKELRTDVLNVGDYLFRNHPEEWRKLQPRWEELFPDMKITVEAHVTIKSFGVTGASPQLKEEEVEQKGTGSENAS